MESNESVVNICAPNFFFSVQVLAHFKIELSLNLLQSKFLLTVHALVWMPEWFLGLRNGCCRQFSKCPLSNPF